MKTAKPMSRGDGLLPEAVGESSPVCVVGKVLWRAGFDRVEAEVGGEDLVENLVVLLKGFLTTAPVEQPAGRVTAPFNLCSPDSPSEFDEAFGLELSESLFEIDSRDLVIDGLLFRRVLAEAAKPALCGTQGLCG